MLDELWLFPSRQTRQTPNHLTHLSPEIAPSWALAPLTGPHTDPSPSLVLAGSCGTLSKVWPLTSLRALCQRCAQLSPTGKFRYMSCRSVAGWGCLLVHVKAGVRMEGLTNHLYHTEAFLGQIVYVWCVCSHLNSFGECCQFFLMVKRTNIHKRLFL